MANTSDVLGGQPPSAYLTPWWLWLAADNRADMLMRTLRNLVQAMGGDLEVRAVFPDRAIEISTFSSLSGKPATSRTGKKKQSLLEA